MLSQRIQQYRTLRGLTQEMLARQTHLALATIVKLESGANANPTLKTLKKIAKALRVSLPDLLRQRPLQ